jgi:hypothetical protein|nr:MAG TPA: Putative tail protein [Caudoviricetes sp.]
MRICPCTTTAALPDIPKTECKQSFGQIQKLALVRIYSTGTTKNKFDNTNDIKKLATWQKFTQATDGTKIVVTPFVEAPTQDGGDAITFGGGNDTLGGVEMRVGRNATNMSFALREWSQGAIKALKALECEGALGVYLINEHGQIEARKVGEEYFPLPIQSLFVGDKIHGGLQEPDSNALQFSFAPNYSDDLEIVTAEFNAVTDL